MKKYLQKHPLITYVFLTYLISWSIFTLLILKKHGISLLTVPYSVYYSAAYGPMIAAIITSGLIGGKGAVNDLFKRILKWQVPLLWWFVAFSPLLLLLITIIVIYFINGVWFNPNMLGQIEFLPDIGWGALFLWLLTYGVGEETGWRGFVLPILQKNNSALKATFFLWIIWAVWHTPAFFLVYDPAILPGFLIGLFSGAVLFTWLYNSTGGSILVVAVWHGVFNFTTASKAGKAGVISASISTMVIVWAIVILLVFKSNNLSHIEKQII